VLHILHQACYCAMKACVVASYHWLPLSIASTDSADPDWVVVIAITICMTES
jgi:hypothetical protein